MWFKHSTLLRLQWVRVEGRAGGADILSCVFTRILLSCGVAAMTMIRGNAWRHHTGAHGLDMEAAQRCTQAGREQWRPWAWTYPGRWGVCTMDAIGAERALHGHHLDDVPPKEVPTVPHRNHHISYFAQRNVPCCPTHSVSIEGVRRRDVGRRVTREGSTYLVEWLPCEPPPQNMRSSVWFPAAPVVGRIVVHRKQILDFFVESFKLKFKVDLI